MYLTQGLHRAVQQNPDGIATIFGDRVRSFVEQADRVARLAGALRRLGVEPGDRVAYLGLNSDRFIEYYLAVPWADAVLNPVNVRWSPAEIAYSLKDSQTRVLLVDDAFIPLLPAIRDRYIELNTLIYVGDAGPPPGMLGYEELVAAGPTSAGAATPWRRCSTPAALPAFPKGSCFLTPICLPRHWARWRPEGSAPGSDSCTPCRCSISRA